MATLSVFEFSEYRSYLNQTLSEQGQRSGSKAKAAAAAGIHTTYLSQIVSGKTHLSLEQAERLTDFLNLDELEKHFFLLLVQKDRAGTIRLRKHFEKQIALIHKERKSIKKRISPSGEISEEQQTEFYSSTLYPAIHVLVSIPEFQKRDKLASALNIPLAKLNRLVKFLIKIGIVVDENGLLRPGSRHIHLGKDSPHIHRHHAGWRLHSVANMNASDDRQTHYSGTFSLSHEDAEKIRSNLLESLKKNLDVVRSSAEETAYVCCMDFYPLTDSAD